MPPFTERQLRARAVLPQQACSPTLNSAAKLNVARLNEINSLKYSSFFDIG
jgi:hypothetical protein